MNMSVFTKDQSGVGIQAVVMMVVGVVIFTSLMPILYDTLDTVSATGTTGTLLDMVPMFAILGLVLSVIFWAIKPIEGDLSISAVKSRILVEWDKSKAMAQAHTSGLGSRGLISIGAMVGAIIILVVGVILYPLVNTQVSSLVENENLSGSQETLINTVPMFYVLALVFVAIGWALRAGSSVGGSSES